MLLIPFFGLAAAAAGAAPVTVQNCSFGETYSFAIAQCAARIDNGSDRPLELQIEPAPRNESVAPITITVPAKGSVEVPLRAAIGNRTGRVINYFAVRRQDGEAAPVYVEASGFAMSALDDVYPKVDFGSVEVASSPAREIALASHDAARFRIVRVLEKPAQVDARIAPDGYTLRVRVRPDAQWGVLNAPIKLAIDTPRQKEAWVAVHAEIHGNIAPDGNPISIGLLEAGREQTLQLTSLRSKNEKAFRVGSLRVEGIEGSAEMAACTPATPGCQELRLNVSGKQGEGLVRGKVLVELPDQKRMLPIDVQGFFMGEQTVPAEADNADSPASPPADTTPVAAATSERNNQTETAHPPGTGPLLKWSVQDEQVVYGYQVFRADAESGPFVLLNAPAIAAKSSSKSGASYQWRDTSAEKGKTYWYYVGVVYNDGRKEKITPEMRVTAK